MKRALLAVVAVLLIAFVLYRRQDSWDIPSSPLDGHLDTPGSWHRGAVTKLANRYRAADGRVLDVVGDPDIPEGTRGELSVMVPTHPSQGQVVYVFKDFQRE